MSGTTILILLFVAAIVILALLPFIHRSWTTRRDARPSTLDKAPSTAPPRVEPPAPTVEAPPKTAADEAAPDEAAVADTTEAPAVEPEPEPEVEPEPEAAVRPSFRERLGKARAAMSGYVGSIRGRDVDGDTWDEIEEALILADVGVDATMAAVEQLRETASAEKITSGPALMDALKAQMKSDLEVDRSLALGSGDDGTTVWLFVGVNGVGKTTTIGKVGQRLSDEGVQVVMAAGDTFRAAAAEQLTTWAERCGADLIRGSEGADPSSVIFDGVQAAAARGADVVLADTAGRLQNKVNLMEELAKVRRVADREPGVVREVFLVIDATTGQNGLSQAKQFADSVDVTGVVLTKLDGSAKGGIVFAIQRELGLPVKLVGLGESAADLVDFDPDEFVEALFAED
ncbi:MAG: signal recognition particle-docking protein FtsY [Actinomycetota bacterium]|nr:signal recognition particle-docking protein FtsY [Actinomycetota bacterium]